MKLKVGSLGIRSRSLSIYSGSLILGNEKSKAGLTPTVNRYHTGHTSFNTLLTSSHAIVTTRTYIALIYHDN